MRVDDAAGSCRRADAPLAVRMRPRSLDELVARSMCSAPGRRCGRRSRAASPTARSSTARPGAGKTTLARIAAAGAEGAFEEESAVNAGEAEIRAVIERARERRAASGRPTILFLDEIHRFNKAQQDALLPAVEEGLLTLIGATTENPYFEVNSALLSRCQIYELRPLEPGRSRSCCAGRSPTPSAGSPTRRRSRTTRWRCWPRAAAATPGSRSRRSSGRPSAARRQRPIDVAAVEDALQRKALDYDRQGDRHYDYISAWIKATRGSDVDASLYYLAVMLEGGEDPRFIARRMVILASEDVGNADPQALLVATPPPGRRPRRPARVRAQPRPGRRLPGAGAEVQRLLQGDLAPPAPRSASTAPDPARLPPRRPLPRRQAARPRRAATATPTTSRAGSATSSCCPRASQDRRFYAPTDRGFEAELGRRLAESAG